MRHIWMLVLMTSLFFVASVSAHGPTSPAASSAVTASRKHKPCPPPPPPRAWAGLEIASEAAAIPATASILNIFIMAIVLNLHAEYVPGSTLFAIRVRHVFSEASDQILQVRGLIFQ